MHLLLIHIPSLLIMYIAVTHYKNISKAFCSINEKRMMFSFLLRCRVGHQLTFNLFFVFVAKRRRGYLVDRRCRETRKRQVPVRKEDQR